MQVGVKSRAKFRLQDILTVLKEDGSGEYLLQ